MRPFVPSLILTATAIGVAALAAAPSSAAGVKLPSLLVLEPVSGECMWREYTGAGQFKELVQTKGCPHEIWWPVSNPSKVLALGEDRLWMGSHRSLDFVALPHDDITTLWVVNGEPVVGRAVMGEPIVVESYVLKRDRFVPGPTRTYASTDIYKTNILAMPPEAKLDKSWTSMGSTIAGAASKKGVLNEPTAAQKALVAAGPHDDTSGMDSTGMVKVGNKNLAYRAVVADTTHPTPPLVWCSDDTCTRGTPIQANFPTQLAVMPKDGFVLVTEEYTGLAPVVYAEGGTQPVLALPAEARAYWF
jgi:hypothetical protein